MTISAVGSDASVQPLSGVSSGVWQHHHVLDLDEFSRGDIENIFKTSNIMRQILDRDVKRVPTLRGKTIVNLFYEPSTRTRASFELAAKTLGAEVLGFDAVRTSVAKGESLVNTLHTLEALGTDVIVVRHPQSGVPYIAAQEVNCSIINAGDGCHAHPTQALLDLYTIWRRIGKLEGLKVVIIGDIKHSRVARSNMWGMSKMGMKVTLSAPSTLLLRDIDQFISQSGMSHVDVVSNLDNAVEGADVVMPLRLQLERQEEGLLPSLREFTLRYQLDGRRLSLANRNVIVLHPGPIHEDIEIASEVAHGSQSLIEQQVTNGVAVRMALLYLITRTKRGDQT